MIELGTNDFSTDIQPREKWTDLTAFKHDKITAYLNLLANLRQRYGEVLVVSIGNYVWPNNALLPGLEDVQTQLKQSDLSTINVVALITS